MRGQKAVQNRDATPKRSILQFFPAVKKSLTVQKSHQRENSFQDEDSHQRVNSYQDQDESDNASSMNDEEMYRIETDSDNWGNEEICKCS